MNIKISRYRKTPEVIDGHLTIDGSVRLCDTAENATTALPAGTYPVQVLKCHQHARKMPVVCIGNQKPSCMKCTHLSCVNNNTTMPLICPRICPGNGVYHREDGSIIVGKYIAPGCLSHPKAAFDALYDRIRKSAERGHEITLTIEENYPIIKRTLTNYELGTQILKHF